MGLYDREYYRDDDADAGWFQGRAVVWLIVLLVAVYFAQLLSLPHGLRDGLGARTDPLLKACGMDPERVLAGEVWRFLTASFVHDPGNLLIVAFNCLVLYLFGNAIEQTYGSREFVGFFLAACLASQVGSFAVQWSGRWPPHAGQVQQAMDEMARQMDAAVGDAGVRQQVGDAMGGLARELQARLRAVPPPAYGAAGAAMAATVVFLFLRPGTRLPLVQVPFWPVVVIILGLDVLALVSGRHIPLAGNPGQYLAGAAFGLVYFRLGLRLTTWLPTSWSFARRRGGRPRLRVVPREERSDDDDREPVPAAVPARRGPAGVDEQLEAKLDHVLEKVARLGRDSLTPDETQILLRASEIYKRRRGS
jgi:hypothetical protein